MFFLNYNKGRKNEKVTLFIIHSANVSVYSTTKPQTVTVFCNNHAKTHGSQFRLMYEENLCSTLMIGPTNQ